MYSRIMVAIDGSATSKTALDEAIKLSGQLGAKLHLVHVIDEVTLDWDSSYAWPAERWSAAEKGADALLQSSLDAALAQRVACDGKVVRIDQVGQRVVQAIADEAIAWGADLIVVGTHGRRGVHHALLGSVAEGIVRIATKPVLLIRAR